MPEQRWSDRTDFREVATPYNVKELLRSRLGTDWEVTDHKGPHDNGSGTLAAYNETNIDTVLIPYHCPENYERIVRLARNIAGTTGRHREGAQEA